MRSAPAERIRLVEERLFVNDDVKARLEAIAQSQAKRIAKSLRELGDVAAKLTAAGTAAAAKAASAGTAAAAKVADAGLAAAAQGRRRLEAEIAKLELTKLSPFAQMLIAAGAAGALTSLVVALGLHVLGGESAHVARLDEVVVALSQRVESIERTDYEASAASRAALVAVGERIAAAEAAINRNASATNSTLAEIQKAVSAQLTALSPSPSETTSGAPLGLGALEHRLAALEAKIKVQGGSLEELPPDVSHGPGAFPPFESANFTPLLIWLVLSFGLLYLLMAKIALPRVENILHTRAAKITKDMSDANAFRARSEEAAAAHDKTLADARAKAQALAQETHVKLNAEAEAKRHALEADLNAKLASAEAKIAETRAKAMANVEEIAGEAAAAIVEHITGKPVDRTAIEAALAATKA